MHSLYPSVRGVKVTIGESHGVLSYKCSLPEGANEIFTKPGNFCLI